MVIPDKVMTKFRAHRIEVLFEIVRRVIIIVLYYKTPVNTVTQSITIATINPIPQIKSIRLWHIVDVIHLIRLHRHTIKLPKAELRKLRPIATVGDYRAEGWSIIHRAIFEGL